MLVDLGDVQLEEKDKRIYKRLRMQINLIYRVVPPNMQMGKEHRTVARNLSAGGIAFATDEHLKVGTVLQVVIEPPTLDEPIVCISRIVRVEESAREKCFVVGVCYLDMSSVDRLRLDQFVKKESF